MSKGILTDVDGIKVKLTNLEKLIYPNAGHIKAEVIQYYQKVAPIMLKYISGRPLTLIRYPDGIEGKKFYSKNMPEWAPDWVRYARLSEDDNKYVVASTKAALVWLANLAALELHPMQVRGPKYQYPDHFIFDLDPSPTFTFEDLKQIAYDLGGFLREKGYNPFIKTSGSKGLHIYTPIAPRYDHQDFYNAVKKLAQEFIALHPTTCTLRISKERRLGKVLLDIYRNHRHNSCVAPYSLRAKSGAPISMPFSWSDLEKVKRSNFFLMEDFTGDVDPWDGFWEAAVELHDRRSVKISVEGLEAYEAKRDFSKTSEPVSDVQFGANDQYVVQLHDATNLHYDLRLEWEGVLLSWAIPKAMPTDKGLRRMAIRTEDHPVKYLDFQGSIPKNEYGGGEMWIMDRGRYEMISKEEDKIHFVLEGEVYKGEYKIVKTKGDQWLLMLITGEFVIPDYMPMLAGTAENVPLGNDYVYEIKWDGLRALIFKEDDKVRVISRSGSDLTEKFPEIVEGLSVEAESVVLDGEIVVLNENGVSDFPAVISRLHSAKVGSKKNAIFYAFDLLFLDGKEVVDEAFSLRREWLHAITKKGKSFRISEVFEDGKALFEAGRATGIEGIMAKKKDARYTVGVRSDHWVKVKYRERIVALIIGYTLGEGDREPYFGALHLASANETDLTYLGKVGSGFNGESLKELSKLLKEIPKSRKLIDEAIEEERRTIWLEPILRCEVQYASKTGNGTLREPVFIKMCD